MHRTPIYVGLEGTNEEREGQGLTHAVSVTPIFINRQRVHKYLNSEERGDAGCDEAHQDWAVTAATGDVRIVLRAGEVR
jgi:hypothetical protein